MRALGERENVFPRRRRAKRKIAAVAQFVASALSQFYIIPVHEYDTCTCNISRCNKFICTFLAYYATGMKYDRGALHESYLNKIKKCIL